MSRVSFKAARYLVGTLAFGVALCAQSLAAEIAHQRVSAVERALVACGEARVASLALAVEIDKAVAAGMALPGDAVAIKRRMSEEASAKRFAPLYDSLSADDAVRAEAWCKTLGGALVVSAHVEAGISASQGRQQTPPARSSVQLLEINKAMRDSAAVAAVKRLYVFPAGGRAEVVAWLREEVLGKTTNAQFADIMQTYLDRPGETQLPKSNDDSVMGRFARVMQVELNQQALLQKQYDDALVRLGECHVMSAPTLTDPARIEVCRSVLTDARSALSDSLAAAEALPEKVRASLLKDNLPPGFVSSILKGVDEGASWLYDWSLRMGENQRAVISTYEQILNLAQAEAGRLQDESGTLVFGSEEALERYRALRKYVLALGEIESALLKERQERSQSRIDRMRGADPEAGANTR